VHIIWVTFPLLECTAVALLARGHGMIMVDWWVDVRRFGRGRFRKIFMHLVLAHDILPNNTSDIRPILVSSVQQLGWGRAPSSPITDRTDYLSTVHPELRRDYENPVRTAWTAVRTGLCRTLDWRGRAFHPHILVHTYPNQHWAQPSIRAVLRTLP